MRGLGSVVRVQGYGWVMNVLIIIIAYDVGGSNPAPATNKTMLTPLSDGMAVFCFYHPLD